MLGRMFESGYTSYELAFQNLIGMLGRKEGGEIKDFIKGFKTL